MSIYAVRTRTGSLSEGHLPMPAVATPTLPPPTLDKPAGGALGLIFTTLPALLRLTCGLFGAAVRRAGADPAGAEQALLLPAVAVLTGWSVWYAAPRAARTASARAWSPVTSRSPRGLPAHAPCWWRPEVLPGEGSWIAVLASTTVINTQATAPARWSIPAGLLVTAAYVTGAHGRRQPHRGSARTRPRCWCRPPARR